jgi:hypothetical protein
MISSCENNPSHLMPAMIRSFSSVEEHSVFLEMAKIKSLSDVLDEPRIFAVASAHGTALVKALFSMSERKPISWEMVRI